MGKKQRDAYSQVINILQRLKISYPVYSLGQHLSTALSDYGDLWGITDKEIVFALEKYEMELEMNIVPQADVDKIIKDAQNLESLFKEEEDESEY